MIYKCKKIQLKPPYNFIKCNCSDEYKDFITVDACISDEVNNLWKQGVKTTGCCCGHGKELGFIQVTNDCIQRMKEFGYLNYVYSKNFGGIDRNDAFIPKSYGHLYNGYSEGYLG